MQDRLNELYDQRVPPEQREMLQQVLDAERLESQRSAEANARYAGFHITENGREHYLSTKGGQEFLDMAILMRRYVRGIFGDKKRGFARCIEGAEEISPQQFEKLAAWRLENLGIVTALMKINFDEAWSLPSISWTAGSAFDSRMSSLPPTLRTKRPCQSGCTMVYFSLGWTASSYQQHTQPRLSSMAHADCVPRIVFSDEISELDGRLHFYMDCTFSPDEVFGTHVDTADSNNWLNIYAEYDLEARQVCDTLSVILYSEGGGDYKMEYHLKPRKRMLFWKRWSNTA